MALFFTFLEPLLPHPYRKLAASRGTSEGTRNFLTFANTAAIAYGREIARSLNILVACNNSRVCKRQKITSIHKKQ